MSRTDNLLTLKITGITEEGVIDVVVIAHTEGGARRAQLRVGDTLEFISNSRRPTLGIKHITSDENTSRVSDERPS